MPYDNTVLRGVTELGFSLVSDQIESNLITFFDWGLLQVGGFFNTTFPAVGSRLRKVNDPDYKPGQIWEGYRQGWVWESGIPGTTYQPISISGVWVNGVFRPNGSGYYINYPLGQVVFDTPVSGTVAVEHSWRRVKMATADARWFQELEFQTVDFNTSQQAQFAEVASGVWNVLSVNRVQLPAIVVEAVNRVKMTPLQIGSRARIHEQDVLFHILAETPMDRKQLHDLVVNQWEHRLVFFDKNLVEDANAWPLDENGTPKRGARNYPQLVAPTTSGGFGWRVCGVSAMRSEPQESYPPLYRATCRATLSIDLP